MWKDGQVRYNKHFFKVWDSYGLSQYDFRSGSFTEDSRGRYSMGYACPIGAIGGVCRVQAVSIPNNSKIRNIPDNSY